MVGVGHLSLVAMCLIATATAHSVQRASYPAPKDAKHKKPIQVERLKELRKASPQDYLDRFNDLYEKIHNPSNGYFSPDGVPYHSVETLICEAPDHGHLTTSEAWSYYLWLEAFRGWATGDFQPFRTSWDLMERYMIPSYQDQPSHRYYNPQEPATFAAEMDTPDQYPVPFDNNARAGVDPLSDELDGVYSDGIFYATHWLLDVDNVYGFGYRNQPGTRNAFINTFQRGPLESVWRTIPHPEWEQFRYGGPQGFKPLFNTDPDGTKPQYTYTGAPDADARVVQATYLADKFAKERGQSISPYVQKAVHLGDFVRYSMFDKYFKKIPCTSPYCEPTNWGNAYDSCLWLMSWYFAWGGNIEPYDWGGWEFRISASHVHQGYQNLMTAWILSNQTDFISRTQNGAMQWGVSRERLIGFLQWLQSNEGAIAGGATSSWKGRYADPAQDGVTSFFHDMAYDWRPVYHSPPSNNWFGMQVWGMQRTAEYWWESNDNTVRNLCHKWFNWVANMTDSMLLPDGDYQVPGDLSWTGQPDTWTGTPTNNANLHVDVTAWSQDVGVTGSLVHTLVYLAKCFERAGLTTDSESAHDLAKELMDRVWANYQDDLGVAVPEERQDYVGGEFGEGFWEPVHVPSGYYGSYPNGDQISSGKTFLELRSFYLQDPDWPKVQAARDAGEAPVFEYHRFWGQVDFAVAMANYARLYGAVPQ